MANRKSTKGQTTIYKTYTLNYISSNTDSTKTGSELGCSGRVGSSCSSKSGDVFGCLIRKDVISETFPDRE